MNFLASAIFIQAALNFQRQFLCLRRSRNVDVGDNTQKTHVCTPSPLATLPVSLLFKSVEFHDLDPSLSHSHESALFQL